MHYLVGHFEWRLPFKVTFIYEFRLYAWIIFGPDANLEHTVNYMPYDKLVFQTLMMTSSNGNLSRVSSPLCVFVDLRLKTGWVNNRYAVDLGRHCAHYDITVMLPRKSGNPVCLDIKTLQGFFFNSMKPVCLIHATFCKRNKEWKKYLTTLGFHISNKPFHTWLNIILGWF